MSKQWALHLIEDFRNRQGTSAWPHLRKDLVADGLKAHVEKPETINQGESNLCGIAAILENWARDDPVDYAWLGISLFENGVGYLGKSPQQGETIRPSAELRNDRVPMDKQKHEMSHADWMMMASIREKFNSWMSYRSPRAGWWADALEPLRAINTPSDVVRGLKAAGYHKIKDKSAWFRGRGIDNALDAGTEAMIGRRVVLLIHSNMLDPKDYTKQGRPFIFATSDHWVGLMTDIVPAADGQSILPFKVFSWGKEYTVPNIANPTGMPVKAFVENYYGYISASY